MAATNLKMTKSNTRVLQIEVTLAGEPLPLTGYTIKFMAKASVKDLDADAIITKSIGSGIVVTDAVGGLADITLMPSDTRNVDRDALTYDVKIKDGLGNEYTVMNGNIEFQAPVVRTM